MVFIPIAIPKSQCPNLEQANRPGYNPLPTASQFVKYKAKKMVSKLTSIPSTSIVHLCSGLYTPNSSRKPHLSLSLGHVLNVCTKWPFFMTEDRNVSWKPIFCLHPSVLSSLLGMFHSSCNFFLCSQLSSLDQGVLTGSLEAVDWFHSAFLSSANVWPAVQFSPHSGGLPHCWSKHMIPVSFNLSCQTHILNLL